MNALQQNNDYITRKEVEAQYVSKEQCSRNRIEILDKIAEEKTKNELQDKDIESLQKITNEFSNGIKKLMWTGVGLIITTLGEIVQAYFSMKG